MAGSAKLRKKVSVAKQAGHGGPDYEKVYPRAAGATREASGFCVWSNASAWDTLGWWEPLPPEQGNQSNGTRYLSFPWQGSPARQEASTLEERCHSSQKDERTKDK